MEGSGESCWAGNFLCGGKSRMSVSQHADLSVVDCQEQRDKSAVERGTVVPAPQHCDVLLRDLFTVHCLPEHVSSEIYGSSCKFHSYTCWTFCQLKLDYEHLYIHHQVIHFSVLPSIKLLKLVCVSRCSSCWRLWRPTLSSWSSSKVVTRLTTPHVLSLTSRLTRVFPSSRFSRKL